MPDANFSFEAVLNAIPDPVLVKDADHRFVFVNTALCELSSHTFNDILGMKADHLVSISMARLIEEEDTAVFANGVPITRELSLKGADGRRHIFECTRSRIEGREANFICVRLHDITARKSMRSEYDAGREQLRMIFDLTPALVYYKDLDNRVLQASRAWFEALGFDESALNRPLEELLPADIAAEFRAVDLQIIESRTPLTGRKELLTTRRGPRWFITDKTPVLDENGEVIGILGMSLDITEQHLAMEKLRETRDYLESLIRYANAPIIVWDPQGIVTQFNHAFEKLTGLEAGAVIGKHVSGLVVPDALGAFEGHLARARHGERWETVEIPVSHTDGGIRRVLWNSATLFGEDGATPIAIIAQGHDVSRQMAAEESRIRLATAVEQAAEVVMITEVDGSILYVNPAFESVTGYESAEVIGQNPRLLKSGKQDDAFYKHLWETISSGDIWSGHITNRKKDGELYDEEATISPVRDRDGAIVNYVAIKRDVTREMHIEQQMRQAQKLEAIGTLAGGIAHDFNNILQSVLGFTDLAQDEAGEDSSLYPLLDEVRLAALRARELVAQILAFSRQGEQVRRPCRLQPVIKEAVRLLRGALPSTIEIICEIESRCGPVMADPTQIHQVVMNLCTNAFHAMRETGGTLNVRLDERPASLCANLSGDASARRYVCLSVFDTGHGMDPETAKRIFDPYFTTKAVGEGTGLGLSTVYGIVKAHDGAIALHTAPGEGARFEVMLPMCLTDSEPETRPMASGHAPTGSERILFVDDEQAVLRLASMALQHLGYSVTTCESGLEALNLFSAAPWAYDLIITDQTMPKMTGLVLARECIKIRKDMPIILCTGYSDYANSEATRKAGIIEFVAKPVMVSELARAIRRALER